MNNVKCPKELSTTFQSKREHFLIIFFIIGVFIIRAAKKLQKNHQHPPKTIRFICQKKTKNLEHTPMQLEYMCEKT
jgi:hypothetical protein